uniref:Uncharacterized protein n=1 Tax=Anopheles farauti TaxID=69004 RepID=A0A182Q8G4_9DIPT
MLPSANDSRCDTAIHDELRVSPSVFEAAQAYDPALSRSSCVKYKVSPFSPDILMFCSSMEGKRFPWTVSQGRSFNFNQHKAGVDPGPFSVFAVLSNVPLEKEVTGGLASARHFSVTFSPSARVITRLGSSFDRCTDTTGSSGKFGAGGRRKVDNVEKMRLSSIAPPENHGLDARHVSSAPSFSAVTRSVSMLEVRLESWWKGKIRPETRGINGRITPPIGALLTLLSVCTVMSALRSGSPSSSHTILAAGNEPHDSHRIGTGRPAVSSSFGDIIFTRSGFTGGRGNGTRRQRERESVRKAHGHGSFGLRLLPVTAVGVPVRYLRCTWIATSFKTAGTSFEPAARHCSFEPYRSRVTVLMNS